MKKTDIKAAEAINAKANLTNLTKEQLHNTGRVFGGIRFWIGDTVIFPDWADLETYQDVFQDKEGKEHFFPVVKVGLNEVARIIPIGSFRRFAFGIDESVEKYAATDTFHRNLTLAQDDFELLQLFAGKTVKVRQFLDARMIALDKATGKRIPYNKDDVKTFTTQRWPIWEILPE